VSARDQLHKVYEIQGKVDDYCCNSKDDDQIFQKWNRYQHFTGLMSSTSQFEPPEKDEQQKSDITNKRDP